jgi:hypothetical protein
MNILGVDLHEYNSTGRARDTGYMRGALRHIDN